MLKESYSHLSILKKLKRYTSRSVHKQLVKSLIFSRLDYFNNLFIDLPQYQVRRIIMLQKSCASFVKGKFCSTEDVVSLKFCSVEHVVSLKFGSTEYVVSLKFCSIEDVVSLKFCSIEDVVSLKFCSIEDMVSLKFC